MKYNSETGAGVKLLMLLSIENEGQTLTQLSRKSAVSNGVCDKALRILRNSDLINAEERIEQGKTRVCYSLARTADEITVGDVFAVFGETVLNTVCLFCKKNGGNTANGTCCAYGALIHQCSDHMEKLFASTTILDLVERELTGGVDTA